MARKALRRGGQAVDAELFPVAKTGGRGKRARALAAGYENVREHGTHRPLAVGAGDVDYFKFFIGIAQAGEQLFFALRAELTALSLSDL